MLHSKEFFTVGLDQDYIEKGCIVGLDQDYIEKGNKGLFRIRDYVPPVVNESLIRPYPSTEHLCFFLPLNNFCSQPNFEPFGFTRNSPTHFWCHLLIFT